MKGYLQYIFIVLYYWLLNMIYWPDTTTIDKLKQRAQFNKLMSVFNASVLLLTMNFVITLSK